MSDFRADLHCHTTCSDGTFSSSQLLELACQLGLQGLAITDHDTIEAYREAVPMAASSGLSLISGAEFSAAHRNETVHVLAYGFVLNSTLMEAFCERHSHRRRRRNLLILDKLTAHGMPLSDEDFMDTLAPSGVKHPMGRPHIALAMVKKGYVPSVQEAFRSYIGEGKPCYAQGECFSVEETLEIIHRAGGLAIIAHPHLIERSRLLNELIEMEFDGIEGYYARFPASANERWIRIGKRKNWIVTGGSDFHGTIKPHLPLGSSWVGEETFRILQQHFQRAQESSYSSDTLFMRPEL